jgi:hypothetical protein
MVVNIWHANASLPILVYLLVNVGQFMRKQDMNQNLASQRTTLSINQAQPYIYEQLQLITYRHSCDKFHIASFVVVVSISRSLSLFRCT